MNEFINIKEEVKQYYSAPALKNGFNQSLDLRFKNQFLVRAEFRGRKSPYPTNGQLLDWIKLFNGGNRLEPKLAQEESNLI